MSLCKLYEFMTSMYQHFVLSVFISNIFALQSHASTSNAGHDLCGHCMYHDV